VSRIWIDKGYYLQPRELERGGHSYVLSLEYQVFELDGSPAQGSYRGPGTTSGKRLIIGDAANPEALLTEYVVATQPTSESNDYYQGFLSALDDRRQAVSGKLTKAEGSKGYYARSSRWWEGYNDAWREKRENAKKMQPNSGYYVWVIGRNNQPLDEGPHGPHDLQGAKTYARIAATEGEHDRAVSRGLDPQAPSFEIVRRYRAGTGERVL